MYILWWYLWWLYHFRKHIIFHNLPYSPEHTVQQILQLSVICARLIHFSSHQYNIESKFDLSHITSWSILVSFQCTHWGWHKMVHILRLWNFGIMFQISLKFVSSGPVENMPAVVQIIAWRPTRRQAITFTNGGLICCHICESFGLTTLPTFGNFYWVVYLYDLISNGLILNSLWRSRMYRNQL